MLFTKNQISKMKEEEFQNAVLIPLFRKMGFQDVKRFDGGNLERGKDIVMWKPSDLGQRLNFGVVVKAVKITGNAKTSEGAMNVLNQVRQMLKNTYLNPVNGKPERIQRCFVACSKEITAEAMHSVEGELVNDLDKVVEWIEPETNLFGLIEKYLPEQGIFEKLSSVQEELDESMKDVPYRIVADSDKKFHILGKHDKANEEVPFEIQGRVQFDTKTKEGKEALEKFQEHLKKGTPVEIDGRFVEFMKLPEFLPSWMKPHENKTSKLMLQPVRGEKHFPIKIEIKSLDGEIAELDYINLEPVQAGNEEITLRNDKQQVPWIATVLLKSDDNKFSFDFNFKLKNINVNVYQELQRLKFLRAMNYTDGEITIRSLETDLAFYKGIFKAKSKTDQNLNRLIKLLEELKFIQEKTLSLIQIDDRNISPEEARNVFWVANVLRTGKGNIDLSPITTNANFEQAKTIFDIFSVENSKEIIYKAEQDFCIELLGNSINLGKFIYFTDVQVSKGNLTKVRKTIEGNEISKNIEVKYKPITSSAQAYFINWLPTEELDEVKKNSFAEIINDTVLGFFYKVNDETKNNDL